jgi:hypothetical protein
MSKIKPIEVGQELYYVPRDGRQKPYSVTVTKVGRKWAETSSRGLRFGVSDFIVDGGNYSSPGRVYLSEADWIVERDRRAAWVEFRSKVDRLYSCPEHLTEADINALLAALHSQGEAK